MTTIPLPDWNGPAVHGQNGADGTFLVELTAPTSGHSFELADVVVDASTGRADVHCVHVPPTADFVAQVITPLRLQVPAAKLGTARAVCVWIASPDGAARQRLVLALARP
jgi:hypothetical protein